MTNIEQDFSPWPDRLKGFAMGVGSLPICWIGVKTYEAMTDDDFSVMEEIILTLGASAILTVTAASVVVSRLARKQ